MTRWLLIGMMLGGTLIAATLGFVAEAISEGLTIGQLWAQLLVDEDIRYVLRTDLVISMIIAFIPVFYLFYILRDMSKTPKLQIERELA